MCDCVVLQLRSVAGSRVMPHVPAGPPVSIYSDADIQQSLVYVILLIAATFICVMHVVSL